MTTACAVDHDLRAHQAQEGDDEDFAEAVAERQKKLLLPGGECDPLHPVHFAAALAECPETFPARIAALLSAGLDHHVASELAVMAATFMAPKAATVAENQIKHELVTRCKGGGRRCESEY